MQEATLTRQVPVKKIEALMEIGRQEKRDELHSILLLAEECAGRVTPQDICQKLLLDRPESAARALIDRCRYYELLGSSGEITDVGRQAVAAGRVFIPERGRYLVWYTDDPLIPQKLMDLQPVEEPRLHDEVMTKQVRATKPIEAQSKRSEDLPDHLDLLEGRIFDLFGLEHGQIIVKKIEHRIVPHDPDGSDSLKITLRLSPNAPPILSLDGKFKRSLSPPRIEFGRAWVELLGRLSTYWDEPRRPPALRVAFDQLSEGELGSFATNLSLNEPHISGLGHFDKTTVQDVPIVPRAKHDATRWAEWLLLRSVNSYQDRSRYEELVKEARARFPDYPDLEFPSQSQLADGLRRRAQGGEARLPEQYWYLQAPLDLDERDSHVQG